MAKRRGQPVHGWVNLDKPVGISSAKAVSIVRRVFNAAKAGHGGTLDPLASGVLPIALGEATKTIAYAMKGMKSYIFTVTWGVQTTTDDLEGDVVGRSPLRPTRAPGTPPVGLVLYYAGRGRTQQNASTLPSIKANSQKSWK